MRIIIPSFCLVFAFQVQASCFSRILSWIPGLNHGEPVSEMSSSVQKDTAVDYDGGTSPVTSSAVGTESWTPMGYEPVMDVDGSNQLHIEERSEIYSSSGPDMDSDVSVGSVIASDPDYVGYVGLCRALDEGRLDIAVDLVKQDETLCEAGVEYVLRTGNLVLIANFINQTNQANARTLDELCYTCPIETFEKVLDKVDFPQQALVDLTAVHNVGAYPKTFLVLLNKIVKPEDQEKAVEQGIEQLVRWSIGPSCLLDALKGKTFRSERLEHLAIRKAFMEGVKRERTDLLPDDIWKHATITHGLYADELIVSDEWGRRHSVRQFLLKNADRYDLEVVKEKASYAGLSSKFRDEIEEALKTAALGGTRTRTYDIQTVEKAEEVFEKLGHPGISEDVFNIIGDSVALGEPTKGGEGQTASKKAPENVASDVTGTPTEIEGSGDIDSERMGEDQA